MPTIASPFEHIDVGHGIAAIGCSSLNIRHADALLIQGGSGGDGVDNTYSPHGGSGAPGILVNSEVRIECDNVIIAGGIAGNGGDALIGYRGEGGLGAAPIAGLYETSTVTVYIMEGVQNVHLYKSLDGEPGSGREDPNYNGEVSYPPEVDLPFPPTGGDIILPPIGEIVPTIPGL